MSPRKFSLNYQFAVGMLILLLILSSVGVYLYNAIVGSLEEVERSYALETSDSADEILSSYGETLLDLVKSNSHWEDNRVAVISKDIAWIEENVNSCIDLNDNIAFIATSDLSGNILSSTGEADGFRDIVESKGLLLRLSKEYDFYGLVQTPKGLMMVAVSKITDDEGTASPVGALIYGQTVDKELLQRIQSTLTSEISLLTKSDFVTSSSSTSDQDLAPYLEEGLSSTSFKELTLSKRNKGVYTQVFRSIVGIDFEPLALMLTEQPSKSTAVVNKTLKNLGILVVVVTIFTLSMISLLLHRHLIVPLKALSNDLEKLGKGLLTTSTSPKLCSRRDEIGTIANSISSMTSNWREIVSDLGLSSTSLIDRSRIVENTVSSTSKASEKVLGIVDEAREQVEIQSVKTSESFSSIKEMSARIEEISEIASSVASSAMIMESNAREGSDSVARVVDQMKSIQRSTSEAVDEIVRLETKSSEIGKIVDAIKNITSEINLLALNASIEAARAGEHGKGFAVVASEVRKLADQSESSTKQIGDLIRSIQESTTSAVSVIREGNEEVSRGSEIIVDLTSDFEAILKSATEVSSEISTVTTETSTLRTRNTELYELISSLQEIAEKLKQDFTLITTNSSTQMDLVADVDSSVKGLLTIASEIDRISNQFKL